MASAHANGINAQVDTSSMLSLQNTNAAKKLAKAVREVDERQAQSCADDIDALLIFAGLFAAVLAPLLVESFQTLRTDPSETIISLLGQIAHQTNSFSVNNNFINSTSPPPNVSPAHSPFIPSANAKLINALWFISLVLDLACASYGITIKQWLREYLGNDYTSPLAQLRIRHFRNPGLSRWKLYEIAAFLPLLLQTSLAFFLVGLCYFIDDRNEPVAFATIPFVAAWAFFFAASVLGPVLDPVCPYKTPLLQILRVLEAVIFPGRASSRIVHYAEEKAATSDKEDSEIILGVDTIQSDDVLFSRAIWPTLQVFHQDCPEKLMDLLIKAINHRLPEKISETVDLQPSVGVLALSRLSFQTRSMFMDMTATIIKDEFHRRGYHDNHLAPKEMKVYNSDTDIWLHRGLYLLLINDVASISPLATDVLSRCLTSPWRLIVLDFISNKAPLHLAKHRSTFLSAFRKLQSSLYHIRNTQDMLLILNKLFPSEQSLPTILPDAHGRSQEHASQSHPQTQVNTGVYELLPQVPIECRDTVLDVLVHRIRKVALATRHTPWETDDRGLLAQLFMSAYPLQEHILVHLMKELLLSSSEANTAAVYNMILLRNDQVDATRQHERDAATKYYGQAFLHSDTKPTDRARMLYRFLLFVTDDHDKDSILHLHVDRCSTYENSLQPPQSRAQDIGVLNTCLFFLRLLYAISFREAPAQVLTEQDKLWEAIFRFIRTKLAGAPLLPPFRRSVVDKVTMCRELITKISTTNTCESLLGLDLRIMQEHLTLEVQQPVAPTEPTREMPTTRYVDEVMSPTRHKTQARAKFAYPNPIHEDKRLQNAQDPSHDNAVPAQSTPPPPGSNNSPIPVSVPNLIVDTVQGIGNKIVNSSTLGNIRLAFENGLRSVTGRPSTLPGEHSQEGLPISGAEIGGASSEGSGARYMSSPTAQPSTTSCLQSTPGDEQYPNYELHYVFGESSSAAGSLPSNPEFPMASSSSVTDRQNHGLLVHEQTGITPPEEYMLSSTNPLAARIMPRTTAQTAGLSLRHDRSFTQGNPSTIAAPTPNVHIELTHGPGVAHDSNTGQEIVSTDSTATVKRSSAQFVTSETQDNRQSPAPVANTSPVSVPLVHLTLGISSAGTPLVLDSPRANRDLPRSNPPTPFSAAQNNGGDYFSTVPPHVIPVAGGASANILVSLDSGYATGSALPRSSTNYFVDARNAEDSSTLSNTMLPPSVTGSPSDATGKPRPNIPEQIQGSTCTAQLMAQSRLALRRQTASTNVLEDSNSVHDTSDAVPSRSTHDCALEDHEQLAKEGGQDRTLECQNGPGEPVLHKMGEHNVSEA